MRLLILGLILAACGPSAAPAPADPISSEPIAQDPPPSPCSGGENVAGYVRAVKTGEPLYGATVVLSSEQGGMFSAITDERGVYCIDGEAGAWMLDAYYGEFTVHAELDVAAGGVTVASDLLIEAGEGAEIIQVDEPAAP